MHINVDDLGISYCLLIGQLVYETLCHVIPSSSVTNPPAICSVVCSQYHDTMLG